VICCILRMGQYLLDMYTYFQTSKHNVMCITSSNLQWDLTRSDGLGNGHQTLWKDCRSNSTLGNTTQYLLEMWLMACAWLLQGQKISTSIHEVRATINGVNVVAFSNKLSCHYPIAISLQPPLISQLGLFWISLHFFLKLHWRFVT